MDLRTVQYQSSHFCYVGGILKRQMTSHISSRDTSAPYSPSRLSLRMALVCRGFITKDTSACKLICVAIWRPYSTTNEGEVWALQRTTKSAGLRLSGLTIKFNYIYNLYVSLPLMKYFCYPTFYQ